VEDCVNYTCLFLLLHPSSSRISGNVIGGGQAGK
jgi:hypothetical protein